MGPWNTFVLSMTEMKRKQTFEDMGGYSSVCSACSILTNDSCRSGLDIF